jgi:hypothetical protein
MAAWSSNKKPARASEPVFVALEEAMRAAAREAKVKGLSRKRWDAAAVEEARQALARQPDDPSWRA